MDNIKFAQMLGEWYPLDLVSLSEGRRLDKDIAGRDVDTSYRITVLCQQIVMPSHPAATVQDFSVIVIQMHLSGIPWIWYHYPKADVWIRI